MLFLGILLLLSTTTSQAQFVISFSARLTESMSYAPAATRVMYDDVSGNAGEWYDTDTGAFNAPVGYDGIYYISMSVGIPDEDSASSVIGVYSDVTKKFVGLSFNNTATNGVEYASRSYMRNADSSVDLFMLTEGKSSLLGDPHGTTSWTMFRYSRETEYTVSFSTARENDLSGFSESIPWEITFVNDGGPESDNPFDEKTGIFLAPVSGYYFFTFSAMSVAQEPMQAALYRWFAGQSQPIPNCSLNRTATSAQGMDTTSRSVLMHIGEGDKLAIGNGLGSHLGSSVNGLETSWSGFLYALNDTQSDDVVAFTAYMQNWDLTDASDQVISNWTGMDCNWAFDGEPFDRETGIFTVPRSGTYFFSYSVGVMFASAVDLVLTDELGNVHGRIERQNTLLNGVDTLSRDVVVDLSVGQTLKLELGSGSFSIFSSQFGVETAFLGMRLRFT